MKYVILAIVALLAAPIWAVVPMPVPEVVPVRRVTVEGYVDVETGWQWNGQQFRVDILETPEHTIYDEQLAKLIFSTDRDYREAVRNNGFVVRVEGIEVYRGSDRLILVETVRTAIR